MKQTSAERLIQRINDQATELGTIGGKPIHSAVLAHENDLLKAELRRALSSLDTFLGIDAKPEYGNFVSTVHLGDTQFLVEAEFDHGEAPNFNADSTTCGPGSVPSVSILHVLINGDWMKADDVFPDVVLTRWTETLTVEQIERAQDAAEAAMEDAADAARDDIRNYGRYPIKAVA